MSLSELERYYLPNFDLGAHRRALSELRAEGRVMTDGEPAVPVLEGEEPERRDARVHVLERFDLRAGVRHAAEAVRGEPVHPRVPGALVPAPEDVPEVLEARTVGVVEVADL